jgi:hypothetical protein
MKRILLVVFTLALLTTSTVTGVAIASATFSSASSTAKSLASTTGSSSLTRHQREVEHARRVHRAHLLYAASKRRQAVEINHIQALMDSRGGGSWRDWVTTGTSDWWCIRVAEEGGQEAPGNMFGFVPFSGGDDAQQRAEALSILHAVSNWYPAWTTAPGCGL